MISAINELVGPTITVLLCVIEVVLVVIWRDLRDIRDNHLTHIYGVLGELKGTVNALRERK